MAEDQQSFGPHCSETWCLLSIPVNLRTLSNVTLDTYFEKLIEINIHGSTELSLE